MWVGERARSGRAAWAPLGALVAAIGLVLAIAAPAAAAGPVLFDPTVQPRTGNALRPISTCTSPMPTAPAQGGPDVEVTIGNATHRMTRDDPDHKWRDGVVYHHRWQDSLPVGTHTVTFQAESQNHQA